jgi:hypothetical protein
MEFLAPSPLYASMAKYCIAYSMDGNGSTRLQPDSIPNKVCIVIGLLSKVIYFLFSTISGHLHIAPDSV